MKSIGVVAASLRIKFYVPLKMRIIILIYQISWKHTIVNG